MWRPACPLRWCHLPPGRQRSGGHRWRPDAASPGPVVVPTDGADLCRTDTVHRPRGLPTVQTCHARPPGNCRRHGATAPGEGAARGPRRLRARPHAARQPHLVCPAGGGDERRSHGADGGLVWVAGPGRDPRRRRPRRPDPGTCLLTRRPADDAVTASRSARGRNQLELGQGPMPTSGIQSPTRLKWAEGVHAGESSASPTFGRSGEGSTGLKRAVAGADGRLRRDAR